MFLDRADTANDELCFYLLGKVYRQTVVRHHFDAGIVLVEIPDHFFSFLDGEIGILVFVDPDPAMVAGAKACGADRVELYTEAYAREYPAGAEAALAPYLAAAEEARRQGLGLNAGHDLNLENLRFFVSRIPWTDEVSIGHALICDALYYGLENTVQLYKRELR